MGRCQYHLHAFSCSFHRIHGVLKHRHRLHRAYDGALCDPYRHVQYLCPGRTYHDPSRGAGALLRGLAYDLFLCPSLYRPCLCLCQSLRGHGHGESGREIGYVVPFSSHGRGHDGSSLCQNDAFHHLACHILSCASPETLNETYESGEFCEFRQNYCASYYTVSLEGCTKEHSLTILDLDFCQHPSFHWERTSWSTLF